MRKHAVVRCFAVLSLLIASAALLLPQKNVQKVDDDPILRAMRDEMDRSRQLRVVGGGDDAPYFFSYDVTDTDEFQVAAVLGSAISVSNVHFRLPQVKVRVGSYDFDDTDYIFTGRYSGARYDTFFPIDDNYLNLRDALWLSTDAAFKAALESMSRKRAALNAAASQTDKLPDFSRVEPVKSLERINRRKLDEASWKQRAVSLSSLFGAVPEVVASGLDLQVLEGTTYFLSNEGTELRYGDSLARVFVRAEGQAPDGMMVRDAVSYPALNLEQLAPDAKMRAGMTAVAENIRALTHAPVGEGFTGPTLFEPRAAAQLLAQLLGDNLRSPRKPLAEPGRNVNFNPSEFETKVGSRILPDFIDVVDDPTASSWQGKPLLGYYKFDLEGVPGQRVAVVEKGILKSFLTTRQPIRSSATSNGHARLPGGYGANAAAISNLFVTASQTQPLSDLKKKLIDLCKQSGKPYGLLVRKLDYPFSAGRSELQALAQASSQAGGSVRPISPPLLIYRVYPDGREELVRGLRFRGVSSRSLRDVLAASQESAVFDYVNNGSLLAIFGAGGELAPTSVVAPGLLFEEMEFDVPQQQLPKLPVVPPPASGPSQ